MIRRAVVVGSGWGAHAARALSNHPGVELGGIVGRGSPRTRALATELGVRCFDDFDAAQTQVAPEIVVLAVSERAHESLAIAALARGAHLLIAHPVAPDAAAVRRIAAYAHERRLVVRTDYTCRGSPELTALADGGRLGALLRLDLLGPGRWLPIALDVALVMAGPAERVFASQRYPVALAPRVARVPQAFPPTVLIEHASGAVSALTPVPHARTATPLEVVASYEAARLVASLPGGGVIALRCVRGGGAREDVVVPAALTGDAARVHAVAMEETTRRFVDELDHGVSRLCTLEEEAQRRALWSALWRSARSGTPALVAEGDGP